MSVDELWQIVEQLTNRFEKTEAGMAPESRSKSVGFSFTEYPQNSLYPI